MEVRAKRATTARLIKRQAHGGTGGTREAPAGKARHDTQCHNRRDNLSESTESRRSMKISSD